MKTKLTFPLSVFCSLLSLVAASAATRYVWQDSPSPGPPDTNWTTAAHGIQDAVDAAAPGDEIVVTNGVYAGGGRAVFGTMTNRVAVDKPLTLRSVNGPEVTIIQGYQVPGTTNGDGAIRCVYLTNGANLSGFTLTNGATRREGDWDRESCGGGVWCGFANAVVSNCVIVGNSAQSAGGGAYQGTLNNCMLDGNSAGEGGGTKSTTLNYCTLTRNSAGNGGGTTWSTLRNCTLTGNAAQSAGGGGAFEVTLNNCELSGNSARWGGGVAWGTLDNCTLIDNSASDSGGGASGVLADALWLPATLMNCTLIGNSASDSGGGAYGCALLNCIVYFNTATNEANYDLGPWWSGGLSYCCTPPLPVPEKPWQEPFIIGNITTAPLFVDYAGGNLRLQPNSPCINAGNNAYASGLTDLNGLPRIVSGTVDIGAYEYQGPGSVISYAWLQQFGLPTDGSADAADLDLDGHTTWQEWRCQTDPTNALSALRLVSASRSGTNIVVSWQSVEGVSYFLERATDVAGPPPIFNPLATDIPGQSGTTSFTDTDAAGLAPLFYRVGVK